MPKSELHSDWFVSSVLIMTFSGSGMVLVLEDDRSLNICFSCS